MTERITVKCKKCGYELPPDAVFCDNCGARIAPEKKPQASSKDKSRNEIKRAKAAGAIILVLLAVITAAVFIANRINSRPAADETETAEERLAGMSSRVTPEQYEQLDFGMSYDEVTELLGEEGAQSYGTVYIWPGEYFDEADYSYDAPRVELEFGENMKLIGIKEYGVLLGKEIFDAKKEGRTSQVTVSGETLTSMRDRMSYREIADILGAEGVLQEAESDKSGHDKKMYEWKYVMADEDSSYARTLGITFYDDKAHRSSWDEWGK